MLLVTDYVKGCKTRETLHRQLVKALTKGDCFRYIDEPHRIAESRDAAAKMASELIEQQFDTLPTRLKRKEKEIDVSSFMNMANAIVDSRKSRRY